MLIVDMEMPTRCINCEVRLKCKRYVCGLYQDIAEDLNPLMGDKDCFIKGELVRCGECKYFDGDQCCDKIGILVIDAELFYCADGERKDGERRTE